MSTAIAKNLMAEMKLFGMLAAYDQVITDATRDQTGYSEFLDTLLQAEIVNRRAKLTSFRRPTLTRVERLLRGLRYPISSDGRKNCSLPR